MAKQIRELHMQVIGNLTSWTRINVVYVVEDSVDSSMSKSGQTQLAYSGTDTLAEVHAAAVAAINALEEIS